MYIQKEVIIMATVTLQRWGNSQAIRIPKFITDTVDIREGDKVSIEIVDNGFICRKVQKEVSLKSLLKDWKGRYTPTEIDWGEPAGKEIW